MYIRHQLSFNGLPKKDLMLTVENENESVIVKWCANDGEVKTFMKARMLNDNSKFNAGRNRKNR